MNVVAQLGSGWDEPMHEGVLRYASVISVRLGEALGEHM